MTYLIEYPWYELIGKRCKELVDENYGRFGNSWKLNMDLNRKWWYDRLQKNIEKWYVCTDRQTSYKKTLDIINIACMIATNEDEYYGDMIR